MKNWYRKKIGYCCFCGEFGHAIEMQIADTYTYICFECTEKIKNANYGIWCEGIVEFYEGEKNANIKS